MHISAQRKRRFRALGPARSRLHPRVAAGGASGAASGPAKEKAPKRRRAAAAARTGASFGVPGGCAASSASAAATAASPSASQRRSAGRPKEAHCERRVSARAGRARPGGARLAAVVLLVVHVQHALASLGRSAAHRRDFASDATLRRFSRRAPRPPRHARHDQHTRPSNALAARHIAPEAQQTSHKRERTLPPAPQRGPCRARSGRTSRFHRAPRSAPRRRAWRAERGTAQSEHRHVSIKSALSRPDVFAAWRCFRAAMARAPDAPAVVRRVAGGARGCGLRARDAGAGCGGSAARRQQGRVRRGLHRQRQDAGVPAAAGGDLAARGRGGAAAQTRGAPRIRTSSAAAGGPRAVRRTATRAALTRARPRRAGGRAHRVTHARAGAADPRRGGAVPRCAPRSRSNATRRRQRPRC